MGLSDFEVLGMSHFILKPRDPVQDFVSFGGGKAKNLAILTQAGIRVPAWICVADSALQDFLTEHSLHTRLRVEGDLATFSKKVADLFDSLPLPERIYLDIEAAIKEAGLDGGFVAVRSSGVDEDSRDHSFAGLFSSYLFQKGMNQIAKSVIRCWASAFSERALKYRIERGLPTTQLRMGVVIQKMVNADSAGVAFSRNPIQTLDRTTLIVDSVWGLGEGLVSGELDADHFVVKRDALTLESDIAKKSHAFRQAPEGGVKKVPLDDDQILQTSLTDDQVAEVASLAIRLEEHYGCAQDVEWAYEKGILHCLQTRPITTLPLEAFYDPRINGDQPTLWDNSNIVESYGGVTSPFTFSFASYVYREVYRQFFEMMEIPKDVQEANEIRFRNMLGLIRGRIYYNLIHWYGCLLLLPGTATNQTFMETMMGVKQSLSPEHQKIFDFMKHPPQYGLRTKLRLLWKSIERFRKSDRIIREFKEAFNRTYEEARRTDYATMPLPQQIETYFKLQEAWLKRWKAPIINDFLCMIFFGLLKKLTTNWIEGGDAASSLQNDLLCGQGDLESTEPTKRLMRIAEAIDQSAGTFKSWFLTEKPDTVWAGLERGNNPKIHGMFEEFLEKYGFRCVNELKLEESDLHDDPSFVVGVVAGYVRMKSYSIEAMVERETKIREAAEARVNAKVKGLKRIFYYWILKHARKAVKNREDLRFDRTKVFGVIRNLFRGVGSNFRKLGLLENDRDIFYLTLDEIIAYVEGRTLTPRFREMVEFRKNLFAEYERSPAPPDRFVTYGAVGASLNYPQVLLDGDLTPPPELHESDDPNVLLGTPCCPGVVEGVVRVAKTLADTEGMAGEILVTYRTDPGWVPLYPSCSGLVIERGSLLSHSAVVARELGLPTIVGVSGGLMERLETGMRVRVDATRGEIRILEGPQ